MNLLLNPAIDTMRKKISPETEKLLWDAAEAAALLAYAPYSDFHVGAVLQTSKGERRQTTVSALLPESFQL